MTTSEPLAEPQQPEQAPRGGVPRLATGMELIGEYADSGFKQAPYIARRADGQVVQMPRLLYLVAEAVDGERDYAAIGERVSRQFGRGLDAEGAQMLVEEKLRPIGIVAESDGSTPELPKSDPLLALKMRTAVVPERAVNAITGVFRPLFFPPVMLALLAAFFTLSVWLFVYHGIAQSLRQTLYDPLFILLLLGLVVMSAAFHECGHATACAYGGARPGAMGVGIYIVWPAFYTDVTDAYRLGKRGRLRTDLGGVYFNSIFTVATFGAYFLTRWEPLLLIVPLQIMEMLHQFLPFIRLDGYYIVSDLTGVPDMFARIKPTLKSLNPADKTPDEVAALKPWVRGAVTLYVFTVVPLLLALLSLTVMNAPRVVATAWNSLLVQNLKLHAHVAGHSYLHTLVDAIQMAVLVLPIAGLFAMFWKLGRTIVAGAWARTAGRHFARVLLVAATVVGASAAAYAWLPNGNYQGIAAADRGTIGSGFREMGSLRRWRQSFTFDRDHGRGNGTSGQSAVIATTTTATRSTTAPTSTTAKTTPATPQAPAAISSSSTAGGVQTATVSTTSTTTRATGTTTAANPASQTATRPATTTVASSLQTTPAKTTTANTTTTAPVTISRATTTAPATTTSSGTTTAPATTSTSATTTSSGTTTAPATTSTSATTTSLGTTTAPATTTEPATTP